MVAALITSPAPPTSQGFVCAYYDCKYILSLLVFAVKTAISTEVAPQTNHQLTLESRIKLAFVFKEPIRHLLCTQKCFCGKLNAKKPHKSPVNSILSNVATVFYNLLFSINKSNA
uniref:Uncharacterized protein n=1 Tax=Sphaerodactylus townsendi TaxID=933632 RepID=A0ACB8EQE6_9SAUR